MAITKLRASGDEPHLSEDESMNLITWAITGLLLSSTANIIVQDRKGRKFLLASGQIIVVVAWPILVFSSSHAWWSFARALLGLGSGNVLTSGCVYVGEISEDHLRGFMECILQIMLNCGSIMLFAMTPFLNLKTLTICCCLVSIFSLLLLLSLPESPYYLISKGKPDEAESVLMILRGKVEPSDVAEEMKKIVNTVEEDMANRGSFLDLFVARRNVKPFVLSAILVTICCLSGYTVIGSYITVIFAETGSNVDENMAALILSCMQLVVTFVASPFSDRVGRRPILMTSFAGSVLGLSLMALHFYLKEYTTLDTNWLPLISLIIYYVFHTMGMGLITWAVVSELLPLRIKARGVAVVMLISGFSNFACLEIYRNGHAISNYVVFLSYAIVCVFGLLFTAFILPETKRMSFIEIDRTINGAKPKNDPAVKEISTQM